MVVKPEATGYPCHQITHFYFHGLDRRTFLRVHKPEKHGDEIDRSTLAEAKRTGKKSAGIELGVLGTLTLRVVMPWYRNNQRIGYLELGKEISHLLDKHHKALHVDFFSFIFKRHLEKESWETGMSMLNYEADWERFPDLVFLSGTTPELPADIDDFLAGEKENTVELLELFETDHFTIFFKVPIHDVANRRVGTLVTAYDESERRINTQIHLLAVFIASLGVTLVLFFIFHNNLGTVERTLARGIATITRLSRQNERILHAAGEGIYGLDQEGRTTFVNPAATKMIGWREEELIGRSQHQVIHHSHADGNPYSPEACPIHASFKTGKIQHVTDEVFWRRDGTSFPVEYVSSPILTEEGPRGAVVIFRDVTERKQMEAKLHLATAEAKAANLAKSLFLAHMSHEIRTPLNTIIGMGEMLSEMVVTAEQQQYLEAQIVASEGLLALVNDILDLSKIEAGEMSLEVTPFDPRDLVEGCSQIVAAQARDKALRLDRYLDDAIPRMVLGDSQRLRQILLNLLGNAIKFTNRGHIRLEVTKTDGDDHLFSVSDTGIGISNEKREEIFSAFTQADNSVTRKYGGTGLGLAICRQLVAAMGGELRVESELGTGSTFHFTIPLPPAPPQTTAPKARSTVSPPPTIPETEPREEPGHWVLLAEDTAENQLVLQSFLKNSPYRLDITHNGAEALKRFQDRAYAAVLMDVQMPVMDGYTATREIRQWETTTGAIPTPIIALTAHAMREDTEKTLSAGCDVHLSKPVRKARLLEVLEQCITKKRNRPIV